MRVETRPDGIASACRSLGMRALARWEEKFATGLNGAFEWQIFTVASATPSGLLQGSGGLSFDEFQDGSKDPERSRGTHMLLRQRVRSFVEGWRHPSA